MEEEDLFLPNKCIKPSWFTKHSIKIKCQRAVGNFLKCVGLTALVNECLLKFYLDIGLFFFLFFFAFSFYLTYLFREFFIYLFIYVCWAS